MLKLYSLLDNKTDSHGKPMYYFNHEQMLTELTTFVNDEVANSDINPVDFELFELGEYDRQTGKHLLLEKPKHLFNVRTLIKKKKINTHNFTMKDSPKKEKA